MDQWTARVGCVAIAVWALVVGVVPLSYGATTPCVLGDPAKLPRIQAGKTCGSSSAWPDVALGLLCCRGKTTSNAAPCLAVIPEAGDVTCVPVPGTTPPTQPPATTTTTRSTSSSAPPPSTVPGPTTPPPTLPPPPPGGLPLFHPQGWMVSPAFYLTNGINHDPYTGDVATQSNRVKLLDYLAEVITPAVLDWAYRMKPNDGTLRSHMRNLDEEIWGGWQVQDCLGAMYAGSGKAFEIAADIYQRDRAEDRVEYWRAYFLKFPTLCAATAPADVQVMQAMDLRLEPETPTSPARCVAGARVPCAAMGKPPGGLCAIVAPKFHMTTKANATAGTLHAKTPHAPLTVEQCRLVRDQVNPAHMACSAAIIGDDPGVGAICGTVGPALATLEASARSWDERTLLTGSTFPKTIDWGPPVGASWTDGQRAARAQAVKARFGKADGKFMAWSAALCPGPAMTPGPINGLLVRGADLAHQREHMFIASRLRGPLREICGINPVNECEDTTN